MPSCVPYPPLAPLLSARSMPSFIPVEELQAELQVAYHSHLFYHENATRNLLGIVASIYEQTSEPASITNTLKSLSESRSVSPWSGKPAKNFGLLGRHNENGEQHGLQQPTGKLSGLAGTGNGIGAHGALPHYEKHFGNTPRKASDHTVSSRHTPQEDTIDPSESPKRRKSHNLKTLGNLDFFDESGELMHYPSSLDHILGPKYRALKRRLIARFCHCDPMKGKFADFARSASFKLLSATVIVCNFVFIIAQSDYRVDHLGGDETNFMKALGYFFTSFYTLEVSILLLAQRSEFFLGLDWGWNCFDMAIVIVALIEMLMELIRGQSVNTSFLRVIRFFKVSRVLRMFSALRMVKEIRIMVDALSGCFSLFFFCVGMLAIFLSIFAIFFVQGVGAFLENHPDKLSPEEQSKLLEYFGSVSNAMLHLLMSCTGGNDWVEYHNHIKLIGKAYEYLFLIFIVSTFMAFFNVVTSVFCEKAMALATPTFDELCAQRRKEEYEAAENLINLLKQGLQDDGSNVVDAKSFDAFSSNPTVELFFQVRGCNVASAHQVFDLLCEAHETDKLDFATFVSALVKLDGFAANVDTHCVLTRLAKCMSSIASLETDVKALRKMQSQEVALLHGLRMVEEKTEIMC